jgi:hypothetical protein
MCRLKEKWKLNLHSSKRQHCDLLNFFNFYFVNINIFYPSYTRNFFFNAPKREAISSQIEINVVMLGGITILLIPSIVGGLGISWAKLSFLNIIFLPPWITLRILGLTF